MKMINREIKKEEVENITLRYLKASIDIHDMEKLEISLSKEISQEVLKNRRSLSEVVEKAFITVPIISILEEIRINLMKRYLIAKIN